MFIYYCVLAFKIIPKTQMKKFTKFEGREKISEKNEKNYKIGNWRKQNDKKQKLNRNWNVRINIERINYIRIIN